ncbi:hypothetical protein FQN54_002418 [Arachnomyces sp. PD_36]|nr:hypothetical protein FQN54_002418 [Arachnomyces sp. PD_36]
MSSTSDSSQRMAKTIEDREGLLFNLNYHMLARVLVEKIKHGKQSTTPLVIAIRSTSDLLTRLEDKNPICNVTGEKHLYATCAAVAIHLTKRMLYAQFHLRCPPLIWGGSYHSALVVAAYEGNVPIIDALLQRRSSIANMRNEYFGNPLKLAALKGHETAVRRLLARCEDINLRDRCSRTALSWASKGGHENVVKLLLNQADVDADPKDTYGFTPLSLASWGGHERVVKLLLDRDDVDVNSKNLGYPRLCDAPKHVLPLTPYEHCVEERLIDRKERIKADDAIDSWYGQGGESLATGVLSEVVEKLLGQDDIWAHVKSSGRTPLSLATEKGNIGVVALLRTRDDVISD